MSKNEQEYFQILKQYVYDKIQKELNKDTLEEVVQVDLYKAHIENKVSARFQEYYFQTLNNEQHYFAATDFFRTFKKRYSLQGIDNGYLDRLEECKAEILQLIRNDNLAKLYFDKFNKAVIKHGDNFKEKDLGSFFAKLIHTFRPEEYCALDNPIKKFFGLGRESFFVTFIIISEEYKHWTRDNHELVQMIRQRFQMADTTKVLKHEYLTDLKLLDLIFWSKANFGQH